MKTILVDAVNTFVIKGAGIFEEMHELLESYPNKKIIVTNANGEERKNLGLDKMPYGVFSLNHNPNKTDPKYFMIMLEYLNLKAEDLIYFEHNEEAVKSAQSCGITSFHYDHNKKDLSALKNFINEQV